jgi:hypothetical protein
VEPGSLNDRLVAQARREFTAFYSAATPRDAVMLDALVLAHAALVFAMNMPRSHLPPWLRTEIERATNGNEDLFTELRNEVEACATFEQLGDEEQGRVRRVLFDVKPPLFGHEIP